MSIIIISSDSYKVGKEIAQKTAGALGYTFLGREILVKLADKYHFPESKLIQALDESPSLFGMSLKLQKRYLTYIQEAALTELLKDNVVCQGLAAHLYVLCISHVLRVRVLADSEGRIQEWASREGISLKKAQKYFDHRKHLRRRWSMDAFKLDETDPSQYDLVISLSQIDQDEAVIIITETISYRRFSPMTYSIKCLEDIQLASRVRSVLFDRFPDVRVRANGGTLVVETLALKREKRKRAESIKKIAGSIPGVEYVEVHVINDFLRQAAESFR